MTTTMTTTTTTATTTPGTTATDLPTRTPAHTFARHRDEGRATWMLNSLVLTKAAAAETGAYELMEQLLTPAANPPMHIHLDEEEAFYVLDGELELEVDGTLILARRGTFAFVPRGATHRYRVLTETARVLVLTSSPGGATNGGAPAFFEAVGEPAPAPVLPEPTAPDLERVAVEAARHGIELVGPPAS